MKKTILISLLAICTISKLFAQVPAAPGSWQWVKGMGSPYQITFPSVYDEDIYQTKLDNEGNVIVSGTLTGYPHIQGLCGVADSQIMNQYQAPNRIQGFMAKYSCDGQLLWFKQLNDSLANTRLEDFVIDSLNNIYIVSIAGYGSENIYWGDTLFAPYQSSPTVAGNFCFMKINKNGRMVSNWITPVTGGLYIPFATHPSTSYLQWLPNTLVLKKDTVFCFVGTGNPFNLTLIGKPVHPGYYLLTFLANAQLNDFYPFDTVTTSGYNFGGYALANDGSFIGSFGLLSPNNKILDSTINIPLNTLNNTYQGQYCILAKFNKTHVYDIAYPPDTMMGLAVLCDIDANDNILLNEVALDGHKVFGGMVTHPKIKPPQNQTGAIIKLKNIEQGDWVAISDTENYAGFYLSRFDKNGDVFTAFGYSEYAKFHSSVYTSPVNVNNYLLFHLDGTTGLPLYQSPFLQTQFPINSTNDVFYMDILVSESGNLYLRGNLVANKVYAGTDSAVYYGGDNDMFVMKYGFPCSDTNALIAPVAAQNLIASCNGSNIKLKWNDISNIEWGYKIYRATGSIAATYDSIGIVSSNIATFFDLAVTNGTSYWYKVTAYNNTGNGKFSNIDSSQLCNVGIEPVPNNSLVGEVYPNPISNGQLTLVLQTNQPNETGVLQITNMVGQELYSQPIVIKNGVTQWQLNIGNDLSGGTYLLCVKTKTSRFSKRLMVVK